MLTANLNIASSVANIISLLSVGKEVLLILTLNCVSSCRSQSEASKGDDSMRLRIAFAVALPGVVELSFVAEEARPLRALLTDRLGMNGSWVGAEGVDRGRPRPRLGMSMGRLAGVSLY